MCICNDLCIEVGGQVSGVSSHLTLCFQAGSLLFVLLSSLDYLACQLPGDFSVCASHVAVGVLGLQMYATTPSFSHGFWGSEFRLSGYATSGFYPLSHLLVLFVLFCFDTESLFSQAAFKPAV